MPCISGAERLKFFIGKRILIIQLIRTANHTRFVTDVSQSPHAQDPGSPIPVRDDNSGEIEKWVEIGYNNASGRVVKLVYTHALGACAVRRGGSSPLSPTTLR